MFLTLLFYAGAAACAGGLFWFGIWVDDADDGDVDPPRAARVTPCVVIEPSSSHPSSQHGPWVLRSPARQND